MRTSCRPYQTEADYWRIREFLREVFLLNGRHEYSWPLYRFDYWRWHVNENIVRRPLAEAIFLWETPDGRLASVVNSDDRGEVALQVHPEWGTGELVAEMVETAEEHLAEVLEGGRRVLTLRADSRDDTRQEVLVSRGYQQGDWPEYQRRRSLDAPIPAASLPPGFTVRPLEGGLELLERCYASGLAFHPDEVEIAIQNRRDVTWYRNIQSAPLYRRDLDLVAITPDGEVAAFTTIWFDDFTRTGAFEPVGTVPEFQRRGLAKALLVEGLHQLSRRGATLAAVSSYSERAGALYASVGFTEFDLSEPWTREW